MRTRRWILVTALLVAFIVLVTYHGWNLLQVNERIKTYVILKLKPALGAEFNIQKLDMSLGAVHLKNVSVEDNDFVLRIDDIRIGFNFISLMKNNFVPQRIPHDILLIHPQLTITHHSRQQADELTVATTSKASEPVDYWAKLQDLDFIKRITISKGKINYRESERQEEVQLAHEINGWLSTKNPGIILARLVGKLFQSSQFNLLLTSTIDVSNRRLDRVEAKITNFEWQESIPSITPTYLDIKHGIVDGVISLTHDDSTAKKLKLQGAVSLTNGEIEVPGKGLFFNQINIRAKLSEQNCIIENSSCLFNGSPFIIEGTIKDIFTPSLDIVFQSEHFDLQKNLRYLAPKSHVKLRGQSQFTLHLTNTFENPALDGQLSCSQMSFADKIVDQLELRVQFQSSILKIRNLSAELGRLDLTGHGQIDFSQPKESIFFSINGQGEVAPPFVKWPFPSLQQNQSQVFIQGGGDFSQVSGNAEIQLKTVGKSDTTFQFDGDFDLHHNTLWFDLKSVVNRNQIEGQIFFSGPHPSYKIKLVNVHQMIYSLPELSILKKGFDFKASSIQLEGESSNWRLVGTSAWPGAAHRSARISGQIQSQNNEMQMTLDLDMISSGEKFHGKLNLLKTPGILTIRHVEIEDLFSADGFFYLSGDQAMKATIRIPDIALSKAGRLFLNKPESLQDGSIDGLVEIAGTRSNPIVQGNFEFNNVVLSQVGFYNGRFGFEITDRLFLIKEFFINRDAQPIIKADGNYAFDSDRLNINFDGQAIDVNAMVTTLFNKPGVLQGNGTFTIKLCGSLNRPKLCGKVEIDNGKLGPFAFTRAQLDLGREAPIEPASNSDASSPGGVKVEHILISRAGQFEIRGSGLIPFSRQIPMDLNLQGKGNILSLLPELTPFFKKTNSRGEWTINLGGRPDNPTITGGRLEFSEGELRLANVAPEIRDIATVMELEQDGFLNVKFITGKIKGKEFTFRNFRLDSLAHESALETFSIPEFGLNFGIFALETSSKGIPLHIPGLMSRGEVGQFVFSGKTDSEPFYLMGPLERPTVRGKVQLHNVNFTFPFLVEGSVDTTRVNPVVDVLTHINWELTAIAGKDAHYQRNIPSGVDHVYLDLILDAGVGALDFRGVISDKTFSVTGSIESSRGSVEYLDLDFQVVKAGAEFDMDISPKQDVEFDKSSLLPIIYGEARTTVIDSTGYPYYVYLTLLTIDKETGQTMKRGRLGEVIFQLSADNPNLGYSEGELLASLGYSISNMPKVATDVIGISTDNLLFRPLFRPFERQLERTLGLDMVRLSSRLARNLIEMKLNSEPNVLLDSRLFLLRSTKLKVGKYLAQRLFLLYTGQLEAGLNYRYQQEGFGFRHTLGLEYRINPQLLLQMEYDYNSLLLWQKEDKRILLRHSFPF